MDKINEKIRLKEEKEQRLKEQKLREKQIKEEQEEQKRLDKINQIKQFKELNLLLQNKKKKMVSNQINFKKIKKNSIISEK